tara:strand:- start:1021 stop:1380 length:360 start_codon:yes stop_codon:yes gene_type:complete
MALSSNTTQTNLYVNQGTDFSSEITLVNDDGTAKDLTSYTARSYFAKSPTSDTRHEITAEVASPATSGVVTLRLSASDTISIKGGSYLYDVEIIYSSGGVTTTERVLEGILELAPSISQ